MNNCHDSSQSKFLTKEQEETRSYISIPASPKANEEQRIPAGSAGIKKERRQNNDNRLNIQL